MTKQYKPSVTLTIAPESRARLEEHAQACDVSLSALIESLSLLAPETIKAQVEKAAPVLKEEKAARLAAARLARTPKQALSKILQDMSEEEVQAILDAKRGAKPA